MLITTENKLLIRLAWGPRKATTKTRYGEVKKTYPEKITASHKLWLIWLKIGLKNWLLYNPQKVIPQSKAKKRIQTALEKTEKLAPTLTETEAEQWKQKRALLRKQKKFQEADAIRDKLLAAGFSVEDQKLKKET